MKSGCWARLFRGSVGSEDVVQGVSGINEHVSPYAVQLGERLRAVRLLRGLTLRDVEVASHGEFKMSILGAYERGERIVTVTRLQRVAQFYNVAVDQLLPGLVTDTSNAGLDSNLVTRGRLTLDLVQLSRSDFPEKPVVARYVRGIQVLRRNFSERMITLRADDARLIAGMLSLGVDELRELLRDAGVSVW